MFAKIYILYNLDIKWDSGMLWYRFRITIYPAPRPGVVSQVCIGTVFPVDQQGACRHSPQATLPQIDTIDV